MFDIPEKIRAAIQIRGMKQKAVAEQIGLSAQKLSDVLCKRRKLTADEFLVICQVLKMSPTEFIQR